MGKPTGFLEYQRRERGYTPVAERVQHWREFIRPLPDDELRRQGGRCMDCGTPFCHTACPVNNVIPDWNDLVFDNDMRSALAVLHQTNNFPDFTGRICPAPCEAACTLNLIEQPVTIKTIEHSIVERGWSEGWIEPQISAASQRQACRGRRLGPRRSRLRAAAGARRPRGRRLREGAAHRRPAALRHPRFQAREARHRPPHRADARRRRRVPPQLPCRRQPPGREADAGLRRGGARHRRRASARPAGAGPRAPGHSLRHGVPDAAEPPRRRREGAGGRGHPGGRA